jgi:hypothetical protein
MLSHDEQQWMGEFFRALKVESIDPQTSARYVPLYSRPDLDTPDPVDELFRAITWSGSQSTQVLSGFRGTGKSTELRRLQHLLQAEGMVVVVADIEEYLNTFVPIDVSDFLMFLAGSFGEALVKDGVLAEGDVAEPWWMRAANFMRRIEVDELGVSAKIEPTLHGTKLGEVGADLKLGLKEDNAFRARVQRRMAGHIGSLHREVVAYFAELVEGVRKKRNGKNTHVVFLVDSVEHIRGTFTNANDVQASIEGLFIGQADKLRIPGMHVVYTVPPWLKVRHAQVGALYDGLQMLTAIKVSNKDNGSPFTPGIQAFEAVLAARGDWERALGSHARLVTLIEKSGGHLRDLLRLMADVLLGASSLPVTDVDFSRAISKLKNEMLPIADEHAVWMAHIRRTQRASLEEAAKLPDLARFLDTHQVLAYRNGDEWFDIHPLIADEVVAQAADVLERRAT